MLRDRQSGPLQLVNHLVLIRGRPVGGRGPESRLAVPHGHDNVVTVEQVRGHRVEVVEVVGREAHHPILPRKLPEHLHFDMRTEQPERVPDLRWGIYSQRYQGRLRRLCRTRRAD